MKKATVTNGITLEKAREKATKALDQAVVTDMIKSMLVGRYYVVTGAKLDRFIIVKTITQDVSMYVYIYNRLYGIAFTLLFVIQYERKYHILDETKIKKIAEIIVKGTHPKKIYLFGSHAKGTVRLESDLDLLIIADTPCPKNKRSLAVLHLFPNRDFSLDVFVYHEDEFNEDVDIANTLATAVARESKLIYTYIYQMYAERKY
jgi:predicted nucleotidyltransferase